MLLARLNRWTKARLERLRDERRGRMNALADGLEIHRGNRVSFVPWTQIVSITATRSDAFIGDVIVLSVVAENGHHAQASEHDPEWRHLIDGIAAHLPDSIPYTQWALELVAGNRLSFSVYRARTAMADRLPPPTGRG